MINRHTQKMPLTLMVVTSALIGFLILLGFLSEDMQPAETTHVDEYTRLLTMIEELYIGEYSEAELHEAAMHALVSGLDIWSFYMTPEEYASFLESSNNRYAGIGVLVAIDDDDGGMAVQGVYSESPAEIGGVLPGDIITHIDGESVSGMTLSQMTAMLARPQGEYILLTVRRDDSNYLELRVMYGEVFTDPVQKAIIDGDIGYIKLSNFEGESGDRFIYAVEDLVQEGVQGFIYDVRGNGGGAVIELTQILDYLLPEGEIFIHVSKDGEERVTMSDAGWLDMPAVVLVNRHSFSAAEFFAALLGEYGYAKIVGEQTTGKSYSQTTHGLPGGGALHISTGQYMTKNRVSLFEAGGITPDYEVDISDEDFTLLRTGRLEFEDDEQLQTAINILRGEIQVRN